MGLTVEQKQEAIRLAWECGRLQYKFKPIQLRMATDWERGKAKTRKHILHISRRVGKSTFLFILALIYCLSNPHTKVAFVAPVERRLEDYIRGIAAKVLADCPESEKPEFFSSSNMYVFKNGSELWFAGSNNQSYNALRGSEFNLFVIDEAAFVDDLEELVEGVAMPTLFQTRGHLILSSTSPVTPEHPFKTYAEKAILHDSYSKYTIFDDETIDPEFLEAWIFDSGGVESSTFRREYLCEFVVDEERSLTPAWNDRFIKEFQKDEYFPFYHLYESMDLGFKRDFTCVVFGYYDYKRRVVVIVDEIVIKGPKLASKALADMIKEKEKTLWFDEKLAAARSVYRRVSDNDDLIFLNTMSVEQDMNFMPTSKESLHDMIDRLNGFLREGRIEIDPRCKYLIQCLRSGIWDKERKKLDRSKVLGHYDGTMALAYLLHNLDIWTNPIPPSPVDPRNEFFREQHEGDSTDLKEMKELFRGFQKDLNKEE